jgi:hypothetical protein
MESSTPSSSSESQAIQMTSKQIHASKKPKTKFKFKSKH